MKQSIQVTTKYGDSRRNSRAQKGALGTSAADRAILGASKAKLLQILAMRSATDLDGESQQ